MIISLEREILKELGFGIRYISPVNFLERFQRIFHMDLEESDIKAKEIGELSRRLCRFMIFSSSFLQYKPSQIAAASFLLGIKIGFSSGVARLNNE